MYPRCVPVLLLVTTIVAALVILAGAAFVLSRAKVRVPSGGALVIYGSGREPTVSFTDTVVMPLVARAEAIDCSTKIIAVAREGRDALRCHDDLRVDIRAEFSIAVNATVDDVLQVARSIGAAKSGDLVLLRELFEAKFADGLATVVRALDFDQVTRQRETLRDQAIQVIGSDLGGWVLRDLAIVRLEQVPLEMLDPNNVHDAVAIRKIHERIAQEQQRTHELRLEAERARR